MKSDPCIKEKHLLKNLGPPSNLRVKNGLAMIDAEGMNHRDFNTLLRRLNTSGIKRVEVNNVFGQRYIGTGLNSEIELKIHGTPGNDLGAFMNGPNISVYGNVQDGCGNTMNGGLIVVHGHVGDVAGYSMRGGKIFIRDDVGYRTGIHMKECQNTRPFMVIGGSARDFLGEYMAGGVIILLGLNLNDGEDHRTRFVGSGMHGGIMYLRGEITRLGKEVMTMDVDDCDVYLIRRMIKEFCDHFGFDLDSVMSKKFTKIVPISHRPYENLYGYT